MLHPSEDSNIPHRGRAGEKELPSPIPCCGPRQASYQLRLSFRYPQSCSLESELRPELDDARRQGASHLAEIGRAICRRVAAPLGGVKGVEKVGPELECRSLFNFEVLYSRDIPLINSTFP